MSRRGSVVRRASQPIFASGVLAIVVALLAVSCDDGRQGGGGAASGAGGLADVPKTGQSGGNGPGGAPGPFGDAGAGGGAGIAGAGSVADVPDFDDLIIQSSHMSAYEGLTVIATFDTNIGPMPRSAQRAAVVAGSAFRLVWQQGFDRDLFGAYAVLFVDRQGDGRCTEGTDPAWSDFVDNDTHDGQPLVHDFDPTALPSFLGPITCAEYETWFGHDATSL